MTSTVVIAGEGEYQSDRTMRQVADDLERDLGHKVTYCVPDLLADAPNFPLSRIVGLDALAGAQLLVIYTRFRQLPNEQMDRIAKYIREGGPVVALRTSTHAFHYPPASPWSDWNDGFGREVLGSPWVSHHGHSSTTNVSRIAGVEHPVLENVEESFWSPSWLYNVKLEPDCRPLLNGTPNSPECKPEPGPVCWTRERNDRRVVYTSLGHPGDFEIPGFRRLLVNAARWCADVV
jgi:type 1 glutamine amidotransferase